MSPPQQWGQGGGGGYAPPPGGGFGQPPQGQPPQGGPPQGGPPPGGGGGFGGGPTPPAGGGYGGGAPPGGPPGGGESLTKIHFSPEDEANISQTALFMRIAGALAILSALFSMVGSVGVGLYRHMPVAGGVCVGLIGLLIQTLLGVLLLVSAGAFSKIVASDGQDQEHLATGLKQLRWYFLIKAILYLLGILMCCGCVILMVVAGAAVASIFAGMAQAS